MCSLLDMLSIISEVCVSSFQQQCYIHVPHSLYPSVHQTNIIRRLVLFRNYQFSYCFSFHESASIALSSRLSVRSTQYVFPPFLQHAACSAPVCTQEPAAIRQFDRFLQKNRLFKGICASYRIKPESVSSK
jgi:hypothetical protein